MPRIASAPRSKHAPMSDPSPPPPSPPWLSLLVPVHGVEDYIEACLLSILSQWQEGVEVVVLDDASPDRSADIARDVAARFPGRIRVLAGERNVGLAAARNRLLQAARGAFVWFLDSDDVLLPGAIVGLKAVIDAGPVDLVMCDFAVLRDRPRLRHALRGEAHRSTFRAGRSRGTEAALLAEGLLRGRQLHAWSKIARREVWAAAPFPEGRYFEDIPVIPSLAAAARHWHHAARPWVGYRQRAGSILSTLGVPKLMHLLQSLEDLHRGVEGRPVLATPGVRQQVQVFALRMLVYAAKRLPAEEDDRAAFLERTRDALALLFPGGLADAIRALRRQRGLLAAWSTERRLRAVGLLA